MRVLGTHGVAHAREYASISFSLSRRRICSSPSISPSLSLRPPRLLACTSVRTTPTYLQSSFFVRIPTSRSSSLFDQDALAPIAHVRVLSVLLSAASSSRSHVRSSARILCRSHSHTQFRTSHPSLPSRPSLPVYLRPWPSCVYAYRLSSSIANVYTQALPLLVASKHGYARARENCGGGRCREGGPEEDRKRKRAGQKVRERERDRERGREREKREEEREQQ